MVHIVKPYSITKNLGEAYNKTMQMIPDGDWACLCDYDTMFLTPDCGYILNTYAEMYPDFGLLTCLTNRIHPLAFKQLYGGEVSEDDSILNHQKKAEIMKQNLYKVNRVEHEVSGFLMLISKKTWQKVKFKEENGRCLGVDNTFCWNLLEKGEKIGVMLGMYLFHSYRLKNIKDKSHLKNDAIHGNF